MSEPYRTSVVREIGTVARDTRVVVTQDALPSQPGQFVMVWVPGLDEKPFSIADADPLTLVIRRVGPVSEELFGLAPGGRLHYRGPFGNPFVLEGRRILLVGGGYGAAPLGFLCRVARAAGVHTTLVVGARTASDLLVPAAAARFADEIVTVTQDGSAGERGMVTLPAQARLERGGCDALYACGPNAMLEAVAALARRYAVPAQLSWERHMRCGIGICGSCEQDGRLVCRDGPVLRDGLLDTAHRGH